MNQITHSLLLIVFKAIYCVETLITLLELHFSEYYKKYALKLKKLSIDILNLITHTLINI